LSKNLQKEVLITLEEIEIILEKRDGYIIRRSRGKTKIIEGDK